MHKDNKKRGISLSHRLTQTVNSTPNKQLDNSYSQPKKIIDYSPKRNVSPLHVYPHPQNYVTQIRIPEP